MVQTTGKSLVLQHIAARSKTPWPCWWLDINAKILITPSGDNKVLESVSLSFVLQEVAQQKNQRVMILGGDDASTSMQSNWIHEASSKGWETINQHKDRNIVICKRDGVKVALYAVSLWMLGVTDIETARGAFFEAENILQMHFGANTFMLSTPTKTGRDILHSHLPFGKEYYVLPDEEIQTLRSFSYQGRNENINVVDEDITHLYNLDAIFMYAACCAHLPIGRFVHDSPKETTPDMKARYIPGFYRATFTVPKGWYHIGLVKASGVEQGIEIIRSEHGDIKQSYPNTPGDVVTNWVSSEELYLAHAHGWNPIIHERIVWPDTNIRTDDPLAAWIKGLREIRMSGKQGLYGLYSAQIAGVARAVALSTVGAFNSHVTAEHGVAPSADKVPANVLRIRQVDGNYEWYTKSESNTTRWSHPEWPMMVWGRARVRMAGMALKLPYESLVALRTDGIWTTAKPERLYDNKGNVVPDEKIQEKIHTAGYWRIKSDVAITSSRPSNNSEFVNLKHRVEELEMNTEELEEGE